MGKVQSPISFGEYSAFHAIDRALYYVLAIDLWRDPIESLEIMALWILFERLGLFKNFVNFMFTLHPSMVGKFADEAVACLRCVKDGAFFFAAGSHGIPLTSNLVSGNISLHYFYENRAAMERQLARVVSEVCAKALPDMIADAITNHAAYDVWVEEMIALGAVTEIPEGSHLAGSPRENRTMFVTFSRGYPVDEVEVRVLFTTLFGVDCIEAFYMQQPVSPDEQPLYARIVFNSTAIVDRILNGSEKAKLTVNKKHLWLRRYVTKPRPST